MRIKDGFVVTDVGDKKIVVPVGETANEVKGIIRLNSSAYFIWKCIEEGLGKEEIANKMTEQYEGVDDKIALSCTEEIIEKLKKDGVLETE